MARSISDAREAELADAQRLGGEHADAVFEPAVLHLRGHREGGDVRLSVPSADAGAEKFGVGFPLELAKALVDHVIDDALDRSRR